MNKNIHKQTVVYLDISEFLLSRYTTGIQRVIREFLARALDEKIVLHVLYYDAKCASFKELPHEELRCFLQNIKTYSLIECDRVNLCIKNEAKKIFFDMDTVWNAPFKREKLYALLKQYDFKIVNFIYDLIPVIFPEYFYAKTKENFMPFLKSVFRYSDHLLFDSYCAKNDFKLLQEEYGFKRAIQTDVIHLGSDFIETEPCKYAKYEKLLASKFILFVGTIEPRKCHAEVLEAFEELHQHYAQLNLVFIGREGWEMSAFMKTLKQHSLFNIDIFHFENLSDSVVSEFYKNAFVVTYLSKYEGYGLPVAEALTYGNITIVSKNSSLTEIGKNFVDYLHKAPKKELIAIISKYIEDENLYKQKRAYIRSQYKNISWDDVYNKIIKRLQC